MDNQDVKVLAKVIIDIARDRASHVTLGGCPESIFSISTRNGLPKEMAKLLEIIYFKNMDNLFSWASQSPLPKGRGLRSDS